MMRIKNIFSDRLRGSILVLSCIAAGRVEPAFAAVDATDNFKVALTNLITFDNNLYRLPDNIRDTSARIGPGTSRDDMIDRASAGAEGRMFAGRQSLDVMLRFDTNRFRENTMLNHNSGNARAVWNWAIGNSLSGHLGAEYNRYLAGFANTSFLNKDLLTQKIYFVDFVEKISPRWRINGGMRRVDTDHSAIAVEAQNNRTLSPKIGIAYETPAADSFGADYTTVSARFPHFVANVDQIESDYRDRNTAIWLKYTLSPKTLLQGRVGYLQRNYPNTSAGDFSGGIGRLDLQWSPTPKTQIKFAAWRELQAYIEVGSSYFVSRGVSVAPTWAPREKLQIALQLSRENHRYQGGELVVPAVPARWDTIYAGQMTATYSPRDLLDLSLAYRRESRDSNRDEQQYKDGALIFGINLHF